MTGRDFLSAGVAFLVFFGLAANFASAQSVPLAEKQKIEALIKQVGDLKDAQFVRSGSTYELRLRSAFFAGNGAPTTVR
ncbi:MAG TPA: hypothetical protein VMT22_22570 [Terriglobales bacterium]|jgi:hypothetical protein|nr:hypothetical protein [Terriglobales bacterium]